MSHKALITGITGQDGAYLAQFLLGKGYEVTGAGHRTDLADLWRLRELGIGGHPKLKIEPFDVTDMGAAIHLLERTQPDEIYNLAGRSFVRLAYEQPHSTTEINAIGVLNLLEAIRIVAPRARFYQASTSEMFGNVEEFPQRENTPFLPRSPYGIAKLYAHLMTVSYRQQYGMFGACGILFNHESPLRGMEFVTRKITDGVAKIRHGKLDCLELGNLNAMRDWGFAGDYVEGMWKMLQKDVPGSYVLATNRCVSVRDFALMAFRNAGIDLRFQGEGPDEVAVEAGSRRVMLRVNKAFHRPAENTPLVGDAAKARAELGWEPGTSVEAVCAMMVEADLRRNQDVNSRTKFPPVVSST
jgi:GDPmannose 4,6-dehydratase